MKHVLIVGFGKTGRSTLSYLATKGLCKNFIIFDENATSADDYGDLNVKFIRNVEELNGYNFELAVVSPGMNLRTHKIGQFFAKNDIKYTTDIDLFIENISKNKKIIGVTGTNGKSTTASMLEFVLKSLGKKAIACGNLGTPVLDINVDDFEYIVLELSSYQIEKSSKLQLDAGVIVNISRDHIEMHGSMENYIAQKCKIFANSKVNIIGIDDEYCKKIANNNEIIKISAQNMNKNADFGVIDGNLAIHSDKTEYNFSKMKLFGDHNIQNALCVISCLVNLDFDIDAIFDAVCNFGGIAHRLQFVCEKSGVRFINDSKATNPDSTIIALKALKDEAIYIIAGGVEKFEMSIKEIDKYAENIKKAYFFGQSADSFYKNTSISEKLVCENLKKCMEIAFHDAKNDLNAGKVKNPVVLLSPLCASFDMYKNFEERGNDFINIATNL